MAGRMHDHNEYMREYYKTHPEYRKECMENTKQRRKDNPEERKKWDKKYREDNREEYHPINANSPEEIVSDYINEYGRELNYFKVVN